MRQYFCNFCGFIHTAFHLCYKNVNLWVFLKDNLLKFLPES